MIAELDPIYIKTRPGKALVRLVSHLFFQGRYLTTRHRWLNSFLLAEMKLIAALPQLRPVNKPIFIIGMGRSGSTILGKVLSMHREVGFLNEPKVIWYTVDPREDVNGNFYQGPAQYHFAASDATSDRKKAIQRIYGFYQALTGSTRIVDKYPEVVYRIPYARELFPDARIVLLIRNGWDTVYSTTAWSKREGRKVNGVLEDWWGADQRKWRFMVDQLVPTDPVLSARQNEIETFTRHEDMAAVEWAISAREGLKWLKKLPESIHLIHYEHLTEKPVEALKALLDFCELPDDKVFLDYAQRVLVPGRTHNARIDLSSAIEPLFLETMSELGYPARKRSENDQ